MTTSRSGEKGANYINSRRDLRFKGSQKGTAAGGQRGTLGLEAATWPASMIRKQLDRAGHVDTQGQLQPDTSHSGHSGGSEGRG